MKIFNRLYEIWARLCTWFGDIMLATKPPKIKAKHIRKLIDTVKVGDIICRKYTYYLDRVLIKGEYTHSGFVISNTNMVHAVSEGVCGIDIIDYVKDCDGFILLRPEYVNLGVCLDHAMRQIGKPYDFLFLKIENERYYCHELTNDILKQDKQEVLPKYGIIYADDFMKKFKLVLRCP